MTCVPAPSCRAALKEATDRWPGRSTASDGICAISNARSVDWPMSKRKCPLCGGQMCQDSKQCAACKGYGSYRSLRRGYMRIWEPGHPLATADGYVLEHRKVVHDAGIPIPPGAVVHHINGDKLDNRLENLEVIDRRSHSSHHAVRSSRTPEEKRARHAANERVRRQRLRDERAA